MKQTADTALLGMEVLLSLFCRGDMLGDEYCNGIYFHENRFI